MGAGVRMKAKDINNAEKLRRAPTEKPPFTLSDLKKAIPAHCFRRSVLRSFSYLVYDLAIVSALLYLALYKIPALPSPVRYLTWPLYWFCQGTVLAGVWNIGHECGHNLFSDYRLLDNIVGFILHSALFVPFFAWKYTHSRHHIHINSLEKDEAFVPRTKSTMTPYARYLNNPPGRFVVFFVSLTVGWPMYLALNFTGRPLPGFTSHYDPYGPFYNDGERAQVLLSDAGLLAVCFGLYQLAVKFSVGWVIKIYVVPLVIVNGWLVLVTYLHHTHPSLPRYDSSEWDWLRGALATVDRDYGIVNTVLHNITDAHVVHHLFLTIPHYHAKEATEAIRPLLGEYYQFDRTPIIKALWREAKECLYVESQGGKQKGVYWFNNKL